MALKRNGALMDRVHRSPAKPISGMGHVGVRIKACGAHQRHIGLLHRHEQAGEIRFLHLAWHGDLRDEPAPFDDCIWVEPDLHPVRARQLAARCRQIARANGRYVPYGFSPPTARFDEMTGRFLFGPTSTGLTCASFVLAVFDYARVPLVSYASWEPRPDDALWQQGVVELLRQHGAPEGHVAAVTAELGAVRYRPEEVAGAAALWPPSVSFGAACAAAEGVLRLLAQL